MENINACGKYTYRGDKGRGDKAHASNVEAAKEISSILEWTVRPRCLEKICGIDVTAEIVSSSGLFKRCTVEQTLTCERAGSQGCAIISPNEHSIFQVTTLQAENGLEQSVEVVYRR